MKTIIKKAMIRPLLAIFVLASFAACSDWTDTESLGIKEPSFPNDNPELYARYLEQLRSYKASQHAIVYTWFDNRVKQPVSRAHHMVALPDSVDVISLLHPDNLSEWELQEIKEVREKGTKVIYTFDYATILARYEATLKPAPAATEEGDADGFLPFMSKQTDQLLSLVDKYGYDGLSVCYEPRLLEYLEPASKAIEQARQEQFVAKLTTWIASHKDKIFVFEGKPQNLISKDLLQSCRYIILHTESVSTSRGLKADVVMSCRDGVPVDRFLVSVATVPLDVNDQTTGRFANEAGQLTLRALTEGAYWTTVPDLNFTKAGLAICQIRNDFYNTKLIYKYTREAIAIMNPSVKN